MWEGHAVNLQLWWKAKFFSLLIFKDLMRHNDWIEIELNQDNQEPKLQFEPELQQQYVGQISLLVISLVQQKWVS